MQEPIKLGFIGLGEHQSRAHIKHLLTLTQEGYALEFVGAFDPNPAAFDDVKRDYGIDLKSFSTADDLIGHPDLTAVFISSPDEYHTKQLRAAVDAGLHVFCEKPVAVSGADADLLDRTLGDAMRKKLVVSSCHPRRFDPPFLFLKERLPALVEEYGELMHFDFSFFYHEVTDEWKKDRSLLSDHFGHEIDLVRFLFGIERFEVQRNADSFAFYEVIGRATDKPSFRFMGSRALKESVYLESVRLDFRKGSLYFNLNTGVGLKLPSLETFFFPAIDYDARFLAVNRNFISAICGSSSYLSLEDIACNNLISVELTENGYASWKF